MKIAHSKAAESAGRLYRVFTDVASDPVEKVFAILKFSAEAPLEQTLELYHQLKSNWLTLAEITTAKPLTSGQKEQVEACITASLGTNICFLYDVDPKLLGGIKVKVGDNVFDESTAAKIRDITLKGTLA